MSENESMSAFADRHDALGRALLKRIAPYLRPRGRGHELGTTWTPLPFDPTWVVGLHDRDRAACAMTVGDRTHDTGIPLALLEEIARDRLPA